MSRPRFRVGRRRPTNIYVQLGDEPSDVDPQIGYANEGWGPVLVSQANEPDPETLRRLRLVVEAELQTLAGKLVRWYDEHEQVEDVSQETGLLIADLRAYLHRSTPRTS